MRHQAAQWGQWTLGWGPWNSVLSFWGAPTSELQELQPVHTLWPKNPALGKTLPKIIEKKNRARGIKMFIEMLFIIANIWKQQEYNEMQWPNTIELLILTRMRIVSILETVCMKKWSIREAEEHKPVNPCWPHGGFWPLSCKEVKCNTLECFSGFP